MNQCSVIVENGIFGSQAQRLVHGGVCFLQFSVLVERPGKHILGVHVLPDFQFPLGQFERLRQLDAAIRVKDSQFAVVGMRVKVREVPNVLDKLILLFRFVAPS